MKKQWMTCGAALLLLVAGCGEDDSPATGSADAAAGEEDSGGGGGDDDDADDDVEPADDDIEPADDDGDDDTDDDVPDAGDDDADDDADDDIPDAGDDDADDLDDAGIDSGTGTEPDAGDSGVPVDLVARGEYLVTTVSLCGDCHTPRNPDGSPALDQFLGGVQCFIDAVPEDDMAGCLSSANLSNHETGLMNRSDEEVKDMFLRGLRPNGEVLHPFMPYWSFANMTEEDADAIVAFLRTIPGIENQIPPNQAPFTAPAEPTSPIDMDLVPMPDDSLDFDSAMRGRYLAAQVGGCMECHTPEIEADPPRDLSMAFEGGAAFPAALLGLPVPPFPEMIFSQNITPHPEFGIGTWTVEDVVIALKEGHRPDGSSLCPPMPAGPEGPFANLTDEDATDIANYLLSIPAGDNDPPQCEIGGPPMGGDAGVPGDAGAP